VKKGNPNLHHLAKAVVAHLLSCCAGR